MPLILIALDIFQASFQIDTIQMESEYTNSSPLHKSDGISLSFEALWMATLYAIEMHTDVFANCKQLHWPQMQTRWSNLVNIWGICIKLQIN